MNRLVAGVIGLLLATSAAAAPTLSDVDPALDHRVAAVRAEIMADPHVALRDAALLRSDVAVRTAGRTRTMGLAAADWVSAAALLSLNRPQEAIVTIRGALDSVERVAPASSLRAELVLAHGRAVETLGKIADAVRDYQQAFLIFRNAGDARGQAVALQQIASAYSSAGDYENALRYDRQSIETYSADPMLLLSAHNNGGNALIQLGRYADAAAEYKKALMAADTIGSPLLQTRILQNLARAQADTKDYDAADATLGRAFRLAQSGPAVAWLPALYGVAAEVALRRNQLDRAATLIDRTFAATTSGTSAMPIRDFHRTAYEIFRARGEQAKALVHLEAYKRLEDTARALTASTSAALLRARFDFANQDLKISQLQRREAQAQVTIANGRARLFIMLLAATAVVMVLMLFGTISIRRSRDQVRAANRTLRTTNQDLAKALAAKTEFLATTSHEIRTPLNGILGMTQVILADKATSPALRSRIELVHGAGETMRALVDDILDVAKIETGELRIHPVEMDLRRLLEDAATVWAGQAETKGIAILLDLEQAPTGIVADEVRLRQVVFNLMSNAVKFTDRGNVRLSARAIEQDGAEHLEIEVQDSGIGIPSDRLDEIFESFRQIDGSTTRRHGGTGLGLTICRSLARAMGGDIAVASSLGAGSAFTIRLPLLRVTLPVSETSGERGEIGSLGAAELLLIEANPLSQGILRALIEPRVRKLHIQPDFAEALKTVASGGIDHVVADGVTLSLDTAAAARIADAAMANHARISVLWPSPDAVVVAALEKHGVHLIAKPITPPELLNALEMIYPRDAASHDIAA